MYICDILIVVSELVDKNPSEDDLFRPKHAKDDKLKYQHLSITLDGVFFQSYIHVIVAFTFLLGALIIISKYKY
jgi:hypothetical protein